MVETQVQHHAFAIVPVMADHEPRGAIVFTLRSRTQFSRPGSRVQGDPSPAMRARAQRLASSSRSTERALREAAERAAAAEKSTRAARPSCCYDLIAAVNQLDDADAVYELAMQTVRQGARSRSRGDLAVRSRRCDAVQGVAWVVGRRISAVEGHSPWHRDESIRRRSPSHDTETDPSWTRTATCSRRGHSRARVRAARAARAASSASSCCIATSRVRSSSRDLQFTATVASTSRKRWRATQRGRARARIPRRAPSALEPPRKRHVRARRSCRSCRTIYAIRSARS